MTCDPRDSVETCKRFSCAGTTVEIFGVADGAAPAETVVAVVGGGTASFAISCGGEKRWAIRFCTSRMYRNPLTGSLISTIGGRSEASPPRNAGRSVRVL